MADRTIGELPAHDEKGIGDLSQLPELYGEDLIPVEHQGEAMKMTGDQFAGFARASVGEYEAAAKVSAEAAAKSAEKAKAAEAGAAESLAQLSNQVELAQAAREGAEAAEGAARASETAAGESADAARASQQAAALSEEAVRANQEAAKTSEDNAKASETAAEAAREAAEAARSGAERSAADASGSASEAAESAETAIQYSGKPPRPDVDKNLWMVWNAESGEYQDTDAQIMSLLQHAYPSIADMDADLENRKFGELAIIASSVEDEDNSKIFIRDETEWKPLGDLSGVTGVGIKSFELTNGNHTPGTTDTYTLTLTDKRTFTVNVYNGANGEGRGDMMTEVYDTENRAVDIYDYADTAAENAAKNKADLVDGKVPATQIPTLNYVPTTRKINNKPLSADITLAASDVHARADTWMPTAADVGAVPATGGTFTGNVYISRNADSAYLDVKANTTNTTFRIFVDKNAVGVQKGSGSSFITLFSIPIAGAAGQATFNGSITGNAATATNATNHIANRSNPHAVTAAQVKAFPITGGDVQGNIGAKTGNAVAYVDAVSSAAPGKRIRMYITADALGVQRINEDGTSSINLLSMPYNGASGSAKFYGSCTGNAATATTAASCSGNAGTATKLATPRSLKTNLAATAAITFDGSGNQDSIPVTGTLPVGHGGTGRTSIANITANLGSTTAANALAGNIGISGTLPVAHGGTGNTTGKAPTAGTADKVAHALTINGTSYDGSAARTINTPAAVQSISLTLDYTKSATLAPGGVAAAAFSITITSGTEVTVEYIPGPTNIVFVPYAVVRSKAGNEVITISSGAYYSKDWGRTWTTAPSSFKFTSSIRAILVSGRGQS